MIQSNGSVISEVKKHFLLALKYRFALSHITHIRDSLTVKKNTNQKLACVLQVRFFI